MLPDLSNCCDRNVNLLLTNHAPAWQGRDLTQQTSSYSTCRWWRKLGTVTELIAAPRSGTAPSTNSKMLEFQAMWPNLIRKCPGVLNTSNYEVAFMSLRKGSTSRNKAPLNRMLGSWIHADSNVDRRFPSPESSKTAQHLHFLKNFHLGHTYWPDPTSLSLMCLRGSSAGQYSMSYKICTPT